MVITKNKMVSLTYDLKIDGFDGELIEQTTEDSPLSFVFGAGIMLPKFESLIEGMEQGKSFEININKEDAYGEIDEEAIVDLPKSIFVIDCKIDEDIVKIGNTVPMMSAHGQRMNGLVLEVSDETVKMDFNHPLAGQDLYFSGEILTVRDASDEEIAATVHSGCGCGSSCGCDDDSCGCEEGSCSSGEGGGSCGCGC